ncbi:HAD-IC family P-type ATPase [Pseudonocardia sp.]|uniref:HAD-IC family P-type ATPase n=1 Tax=Pseudonocardia sp. TaxID=60912 RepID=UPI00262436A1|nr:HAD-IC family P-type ATPase [Pseudonocardia sp.]MCW2717195.1 ATPase, P-type (transporting), superfamily, subfamily [Pseudonocardia sp.]
MEPTVVDHRAAPIGLTQAEADARRRRGESNAEASGGTPGYLRILRVQVFNFYNNILFVIGVSLLALGRYNDAFVSVGLGLVNAVISSVQVIRAKRKLDHLQLLGRTEVLVLRDGREAGVFPEDVVLGDVLVIRPGDQIVVDGPVVGDGGGPLVIDESLLTGEPDGVPKQPGDDMLSGSFCISGRGLQLARDVGEASYAQRLTAEARRPAVDKTPLQRRIEFVIRLVMVLVGLMSAAIVAQAALEGVTLLRIVQISAVLSGLVPYGLFFLIAVAYTVGATRIATRGALIQQVNAVESISNVDVLCTDKTGTLTSGRMSVQHVDVLDGNEAADVERLLGSTARSTADPNTTVRAIVAALPGEAWAVREEVAFTSSLRWSALATADGVWVLGSAEALGIDDPELETVVAERAGAGLRALVFARAVDPEAALHDAAGRPQLPALEPLALVAMADELRDDVEETMAGLLGAGVEVKVLSGDDPRTVAVLAARAGLAVGVPVAGSALGGIDDAALDELVARTTVFGRVSPEDKERVVESLRRQGRYVAMIGDGVNDARALKHAQVGVAMRSGSPVTRDVADVVLVDDSFAALLPARREGRRIIDGIATSMYVFLARVGTQALVILTVTLLGLGFPYEPTQVGLTLLTVGVPTLFLTFWAQPREPDHNLLASLARFVIPAAVITAACGVGVYTFIYTRVMQGLSSSSVPEGVIEDFQRYTGLTYTDADFTTASATIGAQTGLSTFVTLASFGLILFLEPRTRFFAAWTAPNPDRRPSILVTALLVAFVGVLYTPFLSDYFGLTGPARPMVVAVIPALVLWFVALSAAYRWRVLDRLLGIGELPHGVASRS